LSDYKFDAVGMAPCWLHNEQSAQRFYLSNAGELLAKGGALPQMLVPNCFS